MYYLWSFGFLALWGHTTQLPNKLRMESYYDLWMPGLSLACFLPAFLNLNYPVYLFASGFYLFLLLYVLLSYDSLSCCVAGWLGDWVAGWLDGWVAGWLAPDFLLSLFSSLPPFSFYLFPLPASPAYPLLLPRCWSCSVSLDHQVF